jgi:hypothetical protein
VKTVFGGEDGRAHLTWVLAYNAGIEVGSPHYEAIRTFAGGLKAPRYAGKQMEQSVMFLPIAAPDTSQAPEPAARAPRKPAKKRRVRPAVKRAAKPAAKRGSKAIRPARSKPRRPARAGRR